MDHESCRRMPEAIRCWQRSRVLMQDLTKAIEKYLKDNPKLGKHALVDLLVSRFPVISRDLVWIVVARYFNKRAGQSLDVRS
jgi:hypothetical protein